MCFTLQLCFNFGVHFQSCNHKSFLKSSTSELLYIGQSMRWKIFSLTHIDAPCFTLVVGTNSLCIPQKLFTNPQGVHVPYFGKPCNNLFKCRKTKSKEIHERIDSICSALAKINANQADDLYFTIKSCLFSVISMRVSLGILKYIKRDEIFGNILGKTIKSKLFAQFIFFNRFF